MDNREFNQARLKLEDRCCEVLDAKGRDYAGENGDRFANFKLIADILANFDVDVATPLGTWAVYKLKHVFAIMAWIGQATESEPIFERFVDDRNYTDLGWGLAKERIDEQRNQKPKTQRPTRIMVVDLAHPFAPPGLDA